MVSRRRNHFALLALFALPLLASRHSPAAPPSTAPVVGLRQNTPAVFALTNVRIVPEPGRVIEKGTIVVRDGVIAAAGAEVKTPADARAIDLPGKTVYAGLIDAYGEQNVAADTSKSGAASWNGQVTPQLDLAEHYVADDSLNGKLRTQGITARLVAPATRIVRGQSVVVSTGSGDNARAILKRSVAQHLRLTVPFGAGPGGGGGGRDSYPSSPMGAVAVARQTLLDADWYAKAWAAWKTNSQLQRPEQNDALQALVTLIDGNQPAMIEAANEQFLLRADRFAREFGLRAMIHGSGREYRRLDEIRATGRAVIVPVDFPQPPSVGTVEDALDASLATLMHWDLAPENPGRLATAGVTIALTSHGLRDPATFLTAVRKAVVRGLQADSALQALTTTPANLLGMSDRLGKVAPGMAANLVIADGDLFDAKTKIVETWVDGRRFEFDKQPETDPRGKWDMEIAGQDDRVLKLTLNLAGPLRQMTGTIAKAVSSDAKAEEIKLAQVALSGGQLTSRFEGKSFDHDGPARASATVSPGEGEALSLLGTLVWADGSSERLSGARTAKLTADELKKADEQAAKGKSKGKAKRPDDQREKAADGESAKGGDEETEDKSGGEKEPKNAKASFAANYPFGDFGRQELPQPAKLIAYKNATLWTCGAAGIVERGTLLVSDGQIVAAGKDVAIPAGAEVINAAGGHITPGIIDCHSHMASDGGINEMAQAITSEVRIADFIDADDITIYRQLAGGVTAANVLHGSANPIGGQNQVVKLRWGQTGEALKFAESPAGIKFALGENVKQSNLDGRISARYPQSRMGVDQIIRDAFAAARDYAAAHERWNKNHEGLLPRRDLELEAIAEILAGKRWIHCHSYRQDEILALLRTCDAYGIQIGTLQHILEGYKLGDAIAKHGATGSSFSDWWAYKFEVIDAIPFNGALMHRAGVVVSFNSDDDELGRHLNHEAAKAVKYGGVPAEEALKFVTLNPAKQLRIDQWVGSLEAGKHADFVVWSGDPLSPRSVCEQTWIDGRKYFDRKDDRALQAEQAKMRAALIRKVIESGQAQQSASERLPEEWERWLRYDEFCQQSAAGR